MSEFTVSRIVPSTRDLFGALATRRQSLALIPLVDGDDSTRVSEHAGRLDALDVRAFARKHADSVTQDLARASKTTPTLLTEAIEHVEDGQRARFFGADGVVIRATNTADWLDLSKAVQSMRVMAIGLATTPEEAEVLLQAGARAMLIRANSFEELLLLAEQLKGASILIAEGATEPDQLRALLNKVDAAIVPESLHAGGSFEDLQDELDG